MTKSEVILELGSLVVFTYQSYSPSGALLTLSPYHWKDATLGLTSGPYSTLYEGLKAYSTVRKELMAAQTPPPQLPVGSGTTPSNVTYVDFVNKRVIK